MVSEERDFNFEAASIDKLILYDLLTTILWNRSLDRCGCPCAARIPLYSMSGARSVARAYLVHYFVRRSAE